LRRGHAALFDICNICGRSFVTGCGFRPRVTLRAPDRALTGARLSGAWCLVTARSRVRELVQAAPIRRANLIINVIFIN
jgi:hypothetical protein